VLYIYIYIYIYSDSAIRYGYDGVLWYIQMRLLQLIGTSSVCRLVLSTIVVCVTRSVS